MADVPTQEPASLRAGDTVVWHKVLDEYPAGTWTLAYKLLPVSGSATSVTVTASGTTHVATLSASVTAGLTAGTYTLVGTVSAGAERYTVYTGTVSVLADLAAATTYDGRSAARQALETLRATYYAWVAAGGGGRKSLRLATGNTSREVEFESPGDMLERIQQLEREVAREKALESAANYGALPGRVQVRM